VLDRRPVRLKSLTSVAGYVHQATGAPGGKRKRPKLMQTFDIAQNGKWGSGAQRHAWGAFGNASCDWGSLTEAQWNAWDAAAKQEKRRRRWPASRRLTGQNLFTQINSHQAFLGLPPYWYPPDRPAMALRRLGPLVPGHGRGGFTLNLSWPNLPAGHILIYGAPPRNAGRRSCDKFCYLGLLPAPVRGVSDLARMYCAKYGRPRPGSRIIIFTRQQVDGWRGLPLRIDAIVPGGQASAARARRERTSISPL
jgi:hypothetical protein